MSTQAWLGWLAWGVAVFMILWWNEGRRAARRRAEHADLLRRARRTGDTPAPPPPRATPTDDTPAPSFEGWVDAYEVRPQAPAPPWDPHAPRAPRPAGTPVGDLARTRAALADAIARKASIRFEYTDREGGRSTRTVDPERLARVAFEGRVGRHECVIGWCHMRQAQRAFNITRIRDLRVLPRAGSA